MNVPYVEEIRRALPGLASVLDRLAQDKDAEAWADLLTGAGPDILRLALRLIGDAALAEDAVQETLMLVRDHAVRFAVRSSDADGDARRWILGVTANASLQLLRRQQRQTGRDHRAGVAVAHAAPPAVDPATNAERGDESLLLRRELAALPATYGQVLTLHYFAGQDYPALAMQLRVPVNTVRTRVHRGLKALRARLQRCGLALTLAALGGALGELGAADVGAVLALPAAAPGILTSAAAPTTSFTTIASTTVSGGLIMATILGTALAAGVAATIITWSPAQEPGPQPPAVQGVGPSPVLAPGRPVESAVKPGPTLAVVLDQRVTFEFQDTASEDVWRFLAQVTGVPIRVDPAVAAVTITLKVQDMRVRDALTWISQLGGVAWLDGGDHIRVGTKDAIAAAAPPRSVVAPPAPPDAAAQFQALDQEVTLDFQDISVVDAVGFLQRITNLNVVIDPKVIAAGPPPITLRVEQMKLRHVIDFIAKLTGLTWVQKDDALFLTTGAERPVAPAAPAAPAGKGDKRGTGANDF